MKRSFECVTIAEFLANEMSRRKKRNASYSLRAFARDLEVSPSRLSELMGGSAGLSEAVADKVSENLGLKARERDYFRDLVLAGSARNKKVRELAKERLDEVRQSESLRVIKEEQFRVISDWYHGAILELTQIEGFRTDVAWIADKLGITKSQTESAVERLEELGLLLRHEDGRWLVNTEAYSTFSPTPSTAIRKFHRQILNMALDSIIGDPIEDREFSAMILALPRSRLHELRDKMRKFLAEAWESVEKDNKDELYALSIQLCPIRKRSRGNV